MCNTVVEAIIPYPTTTGWTGALTSSYEDSVVMGQTNRLRAALKGVGSILDILYNTYVSSKDDISGLKSFTEINAEILELFEEISGMSYLAYRENFPKEGE